MKLICVMVMSVDGKTTFQDQPNIHSWTSEEDAQHFRKLLAEYNLIIMGSKTYDAAKHSMKHQDGKLRIIMTREKEKYRNEQIPGQLEFTNEEPEKLIKRLEQKFDQGLLVGGEKTNELFFKQNLVTDLWVTTEPTILGSGNGLVGNVHTNLELQSVEKLNKKGTLLLKYHLAK